MDKLDRRHVLGGIALVGGALAARTANAAPQSLEMKDFKKETEVACLYHCDFGTPRRISAMARNINNHLSVYDFDPFKAKIVIVAHSKGVQPYLDNFEGTPWTKDQHDKTLFPKIENLARYGVEVYLCRKTFEANKIDMGKIRDAKFIKIVPSGVAAVAALQGKGFAYLKVG